MYIYIYIYIYIVRVYMKPGCRDRPAAKRILNVMFKSPKRDCFSGSPFSGTVIGD